ncbi:hypothetical protein WMY93_026219, partial [Mugilogobius chulae]
MEASPHSLGKGTDIPQLLVSNGACNHNLIGIDQVQLSRLQGVQNAAARLLTGTKRRDHITPVLKSLHWLP